MKRIRYPQHIYGKRRKGRKAWCTFSGVQIPVMQMIVATVRGIAELQASYD